MMARSTTRSNQRPDTLMQDRSPPARQNPLATHGRTVHLGQTGKNSVRAAFQLCPQTRTLLDAFGMSQRCHFRTHASQQMRVIRSPRRACRAHGTRNPSDSTKVENQVVASSLGIPVAADSCDATLAASLNVELPMNVKLPKGIACRAPDFNRTYTP